MSIKGVIVLWQFLALYGIAVAFLLLQCLYSRRRGSAVSMDDFTFNYNAFTWVAMGVCMLGGLLSDVM